MCNQVFLALLARPVTTHAFRDRASILLLMEAYSNKNGLSRRFMFSCDSKKKHVLALSYRLLPTYLLEMSIIFGGGGERREK